MLPTHPDFDWFDPFDTSPERSPGEVQAGVSASLGTGPGYRRPRDPGIERLRRRARCGTRARASIALLQDDGELVGWRG